MSFVLVPGYAFPAVQPHKWIRNGKYPDAQLQAELANHVNAAAVIRLKEHARFGTPLPPVDPGGSARDRWYCTFRTSAFVKYMAANLGVNLDTGGSGTKGATVTIKDVGGTTVATASLSVTGTGSTVPDTWRDGTLFFLDGSGNLWEPDPYTTYRATFSDLANSSLLFGNIYEMDSLDSDTDNGLARANFSAGTPVLDEDRQAVAELGRTLWQQQGSHLFNWSVDTEAERAISGTYEVPPDEKNLVTNASVDDGSGFDGDDGMHLLDLEGRARVSEGGEVSVIFHARGRILTQTIGFPYTFVKLRDSTGTVLATLTWTSVSSTPSWQSVELTLPATGAYYYVTYGITSGGAEWSGSGNVYAVSLFQNDVAE